MHEYLLADENRVAITAHSEDLVVTTVKTVGKATYTSHDFNRQEEFRLLNVVVTDPGLESMSVRGIATEVYGREDDVLARRVRGFLSYSSTYQKTLPNGTAVIARPDGTLRVTRTPAEFGDLVEENTTRKVAALTKLVVQRTKRLDVDLNQAVDKVPEIAEHIAALRSTAGAELKVRFNRQLSLLGGDDD